MIDLYPSRNLASHPRAASSLCLLCLMVYYTFELLTARAATLYVWQDSPSPGPAYGDWASAAHTIQDAVDAAQAGDLVLVTNGVYASGGRAVGTNVLVNRVAVSKPITLQSVNGPQVTIVEGAQTPGGGNGDGAIRCVYLTNGASLTGFTLTNGATRTDGDYNLEQSGGGLWCESTNALVMNCIFTTNSASSYGGGAYGGTLSNCSLTGNGAGYGGGAYSSTLNNCTLTGNNGGGAYSSTLNNCILTGNNGRGAYSSTLNNCTLSGNNGGAYYGTLTNCILAGNYAGFGGGADGGTLVNCTLTGNSAHYGGGADGSTLINCTLIGNFGVAPQQEPTYGGGAYFSTLFNCTLTSNRATDGGGAYYGTLNNCTLSTNSAQGGGGAQGSTLNNCTLSTNSAQGGGGAQGSTLINCTLTGNSAGYGGGADGSTLDNCTLTGNLAGYGGGASYATLNNCTLAGNSADNGGGAAYSTLNNCIVYFNTSTNSPNYDAFTPLNFCCTMPMPTNGLGNITNAPLLIDLLGGNLRLQSNSPCINAGDNTYVTTTTDLDGNLRIVSGTVDIGTYEYQGAGSVISYAWLQQYGLPTDGSADYTDPDHDGLNNYQEWVADTNPTNAASVLRLAILSNNPPVTVTFSSSVARFYTLLSCSNLTASSVWTPVPGQMDLPGNGAVLTLIDTNPPAAAFYRVSVRLP